MKKWLVLAVGFLVISSGLTFASGAKPLSITFTLAIREDANTTLGNGALGSILPESWGNTAIGAGAQFYNTAGNENTAVGMNALIFNTSGSYNVAVGNEALRDTLGSFNIGIGNWAGTSPAPPYIGDYNIMIGEQAGGMVGSGSWNIMLGSHGWTGDTNTIRIGRPLQGAEGQNRTFIAGISENPIAPELAPAVVGITSDGRLGTVPPESLPPGPQGPAGEGFIPGSMLFLASGSTPPAGYTLVGSTELTLSVQGAKKPTKLTVNVYQKQ